MMEVKRVRCNVRVVEHRDEFGNITPLYIYHKGKKYKVDKASKPERRASTKAGGIGLCYNVFLSNEEENIYRQNTKLFLEIGAEPEVWFVEEKQQHCCVDLQGNTT
ncbi:hypothetical protein U6B65_05655 [Oscillospiraceae bacterium MB08-C2-2]|nr:hypothetical protein U6B65_05655 [Oscillospiraceae bacterium MB08-C2-2]